MSVLVETSFGDMTIDLNVEECPKATYNFLKLCKLKHYNNALFHKVQKDYVAQVTTERRTTIWKQLNLQNDFEDIRYFRDQINLEAQVKDLGLIITSNKGSNLNDSQFFMTLTKAHLSSLDGKHSIFGKVQEGLEVLKKINETIVDAQGRPQMNIRILHTHVLYDPFDDPQQLPEIQSPQLKRNSDRLQAIEHLEMLDKYETQKDIIELTKKQKAKKQAVTLEMLGDLPDANIKPPQNILFICKLNPITQERDLQLIFSRFGPVKSVEIVRDWKTGQSLQYGFIEFESQKSCEEAYLKMDNVLIDDRRIHVDFSQSVSKFMPKMKNKQPTKFTSQKQRNIELVTKVKDDRTYYGNHKYDIISKEASRKVETQSRKVERQYQRNQDRQVQRKRSASSSSISSVISVQSEKKKRKQKKERSEKKQRKQKKEKKEKKEKKDKKSRRQYEDSPPHQKKQKDRSRSRNKKNKRDREYDRY